MITLQVGVKIFLRNKEGKFLLVKRASDKYADVIDKWDIVGGRINPGSSLMDNLQREVFEETKLTITSEPILIYAQDIIPNEDKHVVRLSYAGDTDGEPSLDTEENVEYKWLTLVEMAEQAGLDKFVREILEKGILTV